MSTIQSEYKRYMESLQYLYLKRSLSPSECRKEAEKIKQWRDNNKETSR